MLLVIMEMILLIVNLMAVMMMLSAMSTIWVASMLVMLAMLLGVAVHVVLATSAFMVHDDAGVDDVDGEVGDLGDDHVGHGCCCC